MAGRIDSRLGALVSNCNAALAAPRLLPTRHRRLHPRAGRRGGWRPHVGSRAGAAGASWSAAPAVRCRRCTGGARKHARVVRVCVWGGSDEHIAASLGRPSPTSTAGPEQYMHHRPHPRSRGVSPTQPRPSAQQHSPRATAACPVRRQQRQRLQSEPVRTLAPNPGRRHSQPLPPERTAVHATHVEALSTSVHATNPGRQAQKWRCRCQPGARVQTNRRRRWSWSCVAESRAGTGCHGPAASQSGSVGTNTHIPCRSNKQRRTARTGVRRPAGPNPTAAACSPCT